MQQWAETLSFSYMHEMCGCQRSLNFSSSNMESDEECDACAAVIVAAAMIEAEEQQNRKISVLWVENGWSRGTPWEVCNFVNIEKKLVNDQLAVVFLKTWLNEEILPIIGDWILNLDGLNRVWILFVDWFYTKRNSVWCLIGRMNVTAAWIFLVWQDS